MELLKLRLKPDERPGTSPKPHNQDSQQDVQQVRKKMLERNALKQYALLPEGDYIDLQALSRPLSGPMLDQFAAISSALLFKQEHFEHQQCLANSRSQKSTMTYLLVTVDSFLAMRGMLEVAQRLLADKWVNIIPIVTTHEIIRAVHQNYTREDRGPGNEQTGTQENARKLLLEAEKLGTSDIHIEVREDRAEVLFRIHGHRQKIADISKSSAEAYAQVLYNFESADGSRKSSWSSNEIRDTSFDVWQDPAEKTKRLMTVRFHSAPIHPAGCFQVVLRLLRPSSSEGGYKSLEEVGYTEEQREQIEEMLVGGSGLVLIVGPTNSGKSSSLQSFVQEIFRTRGTHIKVSTIEAPVEYEIEHACQMPSSKENFQSYLEASLRQDPDAVMVGEIRERQAAETVKDLVLAGHKILSTLHVYSAPTVFSRLEQLGVSIDLLTMPGFISGAVYQRLLPVVCPHCGLSVQQALSVDVLSQSLFNRLSQVADISSSNIRFVNQHHYRFGEADEAHAATVCEKCKGTGIVGRTPVAEILVPDSTYLNFIKNRDDAGALEYWKGSLGKKIDHGLSVTALSHAIFKMRQGLVDPRDVEACIGLLRKESQT
ncbi:GspE/PulE family protein [Comamonas sp.]|uniref:GspE/PulE family protein n=1 Tax=Comamonas sp. TaxID=34028 RepID=UPI00258BABBE|nr:ATPase, T2SS/T4P/T4SS family [Comamonas sp.]